MTSHDLARAADLASRFDILSRGKIIASAQRSEMAPDQLLAFYRSSIHNGENPEKQAQKVKA
jgi:heme exporter protein A